MDLSFGCSRTLRQAHFLVSELLAPYHGFWQRYFTFVDRMTHRLSDWTRFRLSRVIKWIVVLSLLSVVLGAIYDETPVRALFLAPQALWSALPIIGQLMFAVVFVIIQFVAIFWFLSRGGIDTYFPDDIRPVLVMFGVRTMYWPHQRDLVFLENPESIESLEVMFRVAFALGPRHWQNFNG